MNRMSKAETIKKWLDEASLWIVETADHDFSVRHKMMCEAIDIAADRLRKEIENGKKKQSK